MKVEANSFEIEPNNVDIITNGGVGFTMTTFSPRHLALSGGYT